MYFCNGIKALKPPVGSYPTPFLGYELFHTTDPNHKTRYPAKRARAASRHSKDGLAGPT